MSRDSDYYRRSDMSSNHSSSSTNTRSTHYDTSNSRGSAGYTLSDQDFEALKRHRDPNRVDISPHETTVKRTRWEELKPGRHESKANDMKLSIQASSDASVSTKAIGGNSSSNKPQMTPLASSDTPPANMLASGPIIVSLHTGLQIDIARPPYCHDARLWLKEYAHIMQHPPLLSSLSINRSTSVSGGMPNENIPMQSPRLMSSGSSLGGMQGISLVSATATLPTTSSSSPQQHLQQGTPLVGSLSRSVSLQRAPSLTQQHSNISVTPQLVSQSSHSSVNQSQSHASVAMSKLAKSQSCDNASFNSIPVDSQIDIEQRIKLKAVSKISQCMLDTTDDLVESLKKRIEELSLGHHQLAHSPQETSTPTSVQTVLSRVQSSNSSASVIGSVPSISTLADIYIHRLSRTQQG